MQAYLHIREHDVVVAKAGLPGIPSGTAGTVVHVYGGGEAYEVEFMLNGSSRVETASGDQIEKR
ncbi:MAG: DUF4926 domain-containing protein [Saprospirales bacterium]|nr:DUF4926 domain-containing protein [Saprospirales bacterium]